MLPIVHRETFMATYQKAHPLYVASIILNAIIGYDNTSLFPFKDRLERELFSITRPYVAQLSTEGVRIMPTIDPYDGRLSTEQIESLVGLVLVATWCFQAGLAKLGRGMYGAAFAFVRKWGMDFEPPAALPGISAEEAKKHWLNAETRRRITFQLVLLGRLVYKGLSLSALLDGFVTNFPFR